MTGPRMRHRAGMWCPMWSRAGEPSQTERDQRGPSRNWPATADLSTTQRYMHLSPAGPGRGDPITRRTRMRRGTRGTVLEIFGTGERAQRESHANGCGARAPARPAFALRASARSRRNASRAGTARYAFPSCESHDFRRIDPRISLDRRIRADLTTIGRRQPHPRCRKGKG